MREVVCKKLGQEALGAAVVILSRYTSAQEQDVNQDLDLLLIQQVVVGNGCPSVR